MSGFELVAGIIAAFFVIGIGVGVTAMIALAALRYRGSVRGDDWRGGRDRRLDRRHEGTDWPRPPGSGQDDGYEDDGPGDGPHRWPGN